MPHTRRTGCRALRQQFRLLTCGIRCKTGVHQLVGKGLHQAVTRLRIGLDLAVLLGKLVRYFRHDISHSFIERLRFPNRHTPRRQTYIIPQCRPSAFGKDRHSFRQRNDDIAARRQAFIDGIAVIVERAIIAIHLHVGVDGFGGDIGILRSRVFRHRADQIAKYHTIASRRFGLPGGIDDLTQRVDLRHNLARLQNLVQNLGARPCGTFPCYRQARGEAGSADCRHQRFSSGSGALLDKLAEGLFRMERRPFVEVLH